MHQEFSVTWIDIAFVLALFLALGIRFIIGGSRINIHKVFAVFVHPVALLIGFVLLAINFSHY